jgi:hypothetical protein
VTYYCRQWLWQKTDPSSCQRGHSTKTRPWLSNSNTYLVMNPRWGSTPRLTDWPSVAMWLWLWLEFSSRNLENSPARHHSRKFNSWCINLEVVIIVCVIDLECVLMNCSYDVWNYPMNRVIKSRTHYLLSRYLDTCDNMKTSKTDHIQANLSHHTIV